MSNQDTDRPTLRDLLAAKREELRIAVESHDHPDDITGLRHELADLTAALKRPEAATLDMIRKLLIGYQGEILGHEWTPAEDFRVVLHFPDITYASSWVNLAGEDLDFLPRTFTDARITGAVIRTFTEPCEVTVTINPDFVAVAVREYRPNGA